MMANFNCAALTTWSALAVVPLVRLYGYDEQVAIASVETKTSPMTANRADLIMRHSKWTRARNWSAANFIWVEVYATQQVPEHL